MQGIAQQFQLFDGLAEAAHYHDQDASGFFSILVRNHNGQTRQSSHRLIQLPRVLDLLDPSRDTWISQAEFTQPNRRVVNLLRLGLLFADLDTYRLPWAAGRTPEQLAASVLYHCADEGIPPPSILIFSGRGLQAKWLLSTALPRAALPRWNACQRHLVERLAALGADPAARDASRVLRLVGAVNTRSGERCRVVHVEADADGQPVRYSFELLAEALLPVARWDLEQQRQERIERRQLRLLPGSKTGNLRAFSARQLAWDRLEDLRRLAALRGGVDEGQRMLHLHWRLNFLLLSGATNSAQMHHEAAALARELAPGWNYRSAELSTLYTKACAYERGERIEFAGREYPPLYTPRNDTLINLFKITDDEQRELRTIISSAMAAERHREREKARRRAAGAVDRATYESQSLSRLKPWEALGMSRRTWYRAGKPMPQDNGTSPCVLPEPEGAQPAPAQGDGAWHKSVRITNGEARAGAKPRQA